MTSDLRTQLKQAIDAHKRERIAAARAFVCSGCGGDRDARTIGCNRCQDRHRKIERRRTDPDFRAREAEHHRRTRAVRAEQQRARRARAKAAQ